MIVLPFPAAILAGHAKGNARWAKIAATKKHREWARIATQGAKLGAMLEQGDIIVRVSFYPANRRGDRVNFPNRMKPYFDGIADALGVNDSRFLPSFQYFEPEKPGKITVQIGEGA